MDSGRLKESIASYEDFDVYKKSYSVSLDLHRLTTTFPQHELFGITNQIRRASKSICANFAEGYARSAYNPADFKRYIFMAIGSSDEIQVWLDYARDLGYIETAKANELKSEYKSIAKMLMNLQKSITAMKRKIPA